MGLVGGEPHPGQQPEVIFSEGFQAFISSSVHPFSHRPIHPVPSCTFMLWTLGPGRLSPPALCLSPSPARGCPEESMWYRT